VNGYGPHFPLFSRFFIKSGRRCAMVSKTIASEFMLYVNGQAPDAF
jgi:hypothetical protein